MMTERKLTLFVLLAVLALVLQACAPADVSGLVATGIAGTQQAGGGAPLQPTQAEQATTAPTATQAEPTLEPTMAPTQPIVPQTGGGGALLVVSQDTNCRSGPGTRYTWRGTVTAGSQVEVLKTFSGGDYVVIANPSGEGECWLWLAYANPRSFADQGLPAATQPPTPTIVPSPTATALPPFDWSGDWRVKIVDNTNTEIYGTASFSAHGNVVKAWASFENGQSYEFTAELNPGYQSTKGGYYSGSASGGWYALMQPSLNQFNGNMDGTWQLCGWRSYSSMPSSCGN